MKIMVNGALGRMGGMVLTAASQAGDVEVVGLVERADHPLIGEVMATPAGDLPLLDDPGLAPRPDAGIDFSSPPGAVAFALALAARGVPVLSGTTGLSPGQMSAMREAAKTAPVLWASNTSLGVYCLGELSAMARRILGSSYDVEIVEVHHRHKRDAPSGTALSLASRIAEGGLAVKSSRSGDVGPRLRDEIGVLAVRGGEVIGEHTVMFLGDHDRIEITHRAASRMLFAQGAIALARRLMTMPAGFYTVPDVL